MKDLKLFDPTFEPREEKLSYAPRPHSLQGLCIGLVENTKYNSNKLLLKVSEILEREHGTHGHLMRSKQNASVPAHEEVLADLASQCKAVVAGIGDWGSCSSGSLLDSILFEKRGVPSAAIVTDAFTSTAKAMARSWGVPNHPFVTVPHPISNLTDEQLDRLARDVAPKVVRILLEKPD
jgi:hypothetical protein